MLLILLTALSCTALKLADPVALRDVVDTEDNQSLAAWCSGTGCVMPFTPASCLSWCDWNVDKQADAEARGAFSNGNVWKKKQVKATTFNIQIGQSTINGDQPPNAVFGAPITYYFQAADTDDKKGAKDCGVTCKTSAPIFPGGDDEKVFSQTSLKCGRCYKIASDKAAVAKDVSKANSHGLATHYYVKFGEGAAPNDGKPKMTVTSGKDGSAGCAGDPIWDPILGATETGGAGNKAAPVITNGADDDSARNACRLIIGNGSLKVGACVATGCDNEALKVTYCVSFSGTKFSGVFAPANCKDP